MNVTYDGRPYLGAAVGSREYVTAHVESKIDEWVSDMKYLIAETQPHAAFSAFTHGLPSKWTYLSPTIPDIGPVMKPLDDALHSDLIPAK